MLHFYTISVKPQTVSDSSRLLGWSKGGCGLDDPQT